jgi:hypothetical protein
MKHLLSSSAFLVVNKSLAKQIGLKETILLADLISKEEYFIANGMSDGWFFNTEANIEADTTLTPFQQRKCLKSLRKYGIIETKRRGVPAKQFFKINEQLVVKFLNNLSFTNCTTINKNKIITIHNKYFNKPKLSEVKDYCWMVGKNKMKDWKAAVRTWEKKNYNKPKGMSKLDAQINEWQEAKKLL